MKQHDQIKFFIHFTMWETNQLHFLWCSLIDARVVQNWTRRVFAIMPSIDLSDRLRCGVAKGMLASSFSVDKLNLAESTLRVGSRGHCFWNVSVISALQHAAVERYYWWSRLVVARWRWCFRCFSSKSKCGLAKTQMTKQQTSGELFVLKLALALATRVEAK